MTNLASAQAWALEDNQPQAKILVLGYTYALKPGGVIPHLELLCDDNSNAEELSYFGCCREIAHSLSEIWEMV